MSDHCAMSIPRWARRLWPGRKTFVVLGPPGEPLPPDGPRRFTEHHARLLSQLQSEARTDWPGIALLACLEPLRTSDVTEAGEVAVMDGWIDGPDAFCVVYQPPYEAGKVGIRRAVDDAAPSRRQKYRPGEMTEYYDMGATEIPDPVAFGWNVADFDIGEPGTGPLRHDEDNGTSWWGSLGDALPMRHTAPWQEIGQPQTSSAGASCAFTGDAKIGRESDAFLPGWPRLTGRVYQPVELVVELT